MGTIRLVRATKKIRSTDFSSGSDHVIFSNQPTGEVAGTLDSILEKAGMTPVLMTSRRTLAHASSELIFAARIVRDAAELLAEEAGEVENSARYLLVADRISTALDSPRPSRRRLLSASPFLQERSGRIRTLVEMIEAEPEGSDRLRLAKLLYRVLVWLPESSSRPAS